MQNAELEGRQKLWRPLILAAIRPDRRNLAGRAARRSRRQSEAPAS